jgi:hypothetical protein
MIRMRIQFDEAEYALARKEARALGISMAEFVRRAVCDKLRVADEASWMRYAGLVESGDSRSGKSVDDVVYGPPPR